jgi:hypothetical protein
MLWVIAAGAMKMCLPVRVLTGKSGFIFIVYSYFNCFYKMRFANNRNGILNKIVFGELYNSKAQAIAG